MNEGASASTRCGGAHPPHVRHPRAERSAAKWTPEDPAGATAPLRCSCTCGACWILGTALPPEDDGVLSSTLVAVPSSSEGVTHRLDAPSAVLEHEPVALE